MDRKNRHNYGAWSKEELRKAETTASRFLQDNGEQISETMRAKLKFIEAMICRLSQKKTTLDERLDCFARIAEASELLKSDAEGFFELASQPVVAQILQGVKSRK